MRDQDTTCICARIRFQPVIELLSFPKGIDFCNARVLSTLYDVSWQTTWQTLSAETFAIVGGFHISISDYYYYCVRDCLTIVRHKMWELIRLIQSRFFCNQDNISNVFASFLAIISRFYKMIDNKRGISCLQFSSIANINLSQRVVIFYLSLYNFLF